MLFDAFGCLLTLFYSAFWMNFDQFGPHTRENSRSVVQSFSRAGEGFGAGEEFGAGDGERCGEDEGEEARRRQQRRRQD